MMRWGGALAAVILLSACPGFGDKTLAELEGIDEVPTWHADIEPIMTRYCTSCHRDPPVAGAPFSLLTFEQATDKAERIRVRAVQLGSMPPGGPIPDVERARIEAWIAGGMPLGEPPPPDAAVPDMGVEDMGPLPDMEPEADPPTWDGRIGALLVASSCTDAFCHSGDEPANGLDLTSYAGFVAGGLSGAVHGEGSPAEAILIDRLRGRDEVLQMPLSRDPLAPADIRLLETWIAAGFPEN